MSHLRVLAMLFFRRIQIIAGGTETWKAPP
jgi:hypothetical protein